MVQGINEISNQFSFVSDQECHAIEHQGEAATAEGLMFDDKGNLVEREALYES